jgi:iron only hydrogenase large subunit-like protein
MMMGATVKNHYAKYAGINKEDLFVVSIVPCIAKKAEAARPEFAEDGIRDVDAVLTTTELLEMIALRRIETVEPMEFDDPTSRSPAPESSSAHRRCG